MINMLILIGIIFSVTLIFAVINYFSEKKMQNLDNFSEPQKKKMKSEAEKLEKTKNFQSNEFINKNEEIETVKDLKTTELKAKAQFEKEKEELENNELEELNISNFARKNNLTGFWKIFAYLTVGVLYIVVFCEKSKEKR